MNGRRSLAPVMIASAVMEHFGSPMLFLYTATVYAALIAYIVVRLRRRPPDAVVVKTEFDRAAAVPGGGAIGPEPLDPNHPDVATPEASPEPIGQAKAAR